MRERTEKKALNREGAAEIHFATKNAKGAKKRAGCFYVFFAIFVVNVSVHLASALG